MVRHYIVYYMILNTYINVCSVYYMLNMYVSEIL